MKILHVVPTLGYGGVAKVVTNYYEQLDHEKIQFDIITHGGVEDYHEKLIQEGSKIYYFSTLGKVGRKGYKKQIKENINLKDYDIIHIHVGHLTGVYAMFFKKLGAKRVICHAHTTRCVNVRHSKIMPLFRYLAIHYSDARIACGYDAGEFCFGHKKYEIIPNGISFQKINTINEEKVRALRTELDIKENQFVVGHVGAFVAPKNHSFLVDVIHEYLKKNKNAVFVLVGDGILREEIEKKVRNNGDEHSVIFTGIRNDVYAFMKMFDVFILPSMHEGLPVVGIEAQASGTHCLLSENIDKTVDIHAGLVKFLPINNGTKKWVDALLLLRNNNKKISGKNIYNCLKNSGYEITESVSKLVNIYYTLCDEM